MAELKTKETNASVKKFLDSVPDETKRKDSYTILEMMREATGEQPKMWGTSIIGFGKMTYSYASGRTGEMPVAGFSPRKQELTLYVLNYGAEDKEVAGLLAKLGKHTTGKVCLYLKRLSDVDLPTLEKIIVLSVNQARNPRPPAPSLYATSEVKKKRDAKAKAKQTQKSGAKRDAKSKRKTTAKKK